MSEAINHIFGKIPNLVSFAGKNWQNFVTARFLTANLSGCCFVTMNTNWNALGFPFQFDKRHLVLLLFWYFYPPVCFGPFPPCFPSQTRWDQTSPASTEGKSTGVFGDPEKDGIQLGTFSQQKLPTLRIIGHIQWLFLVPLKGGRDYINPPEGNNI